MEDQDLVHPRDTAPFGGAEEMDFTSCSGCFRAKPLIDNEPGPDEEEEDKENCPGCYREDARRITGK